MTVHLSQDRNYCARQERCQQEVRDKLYVWGVPGKEIEPIISQLIGEGYLNEALRGVHQSISGGRPIRSEHEFPTGLYLKHGDHQG